MDASHPATAKRSRADDVAERLARMIEGGEFGQGGRLPAEKDLAERFGVGRPAVRQALSHLQGRGLVTVRAGTRARVTDAAPGAATEPVARLVRQLASTPDGQRQMEEARVLFEAGVAFQAAQAATDADVARLRGRLDANAAAQGDPALFIQTDVAFHHELVAITGNAAFEAVHAALRGWLIDQRTNTIHMPRSDELSVRDHAAIFEAVAAREPLRAFAEMSSHLRLISELYREARRISDEVFRSMVKEVTERVARETDALWEGGTRARKPARAPR